MSSTTKRTAMPLMLIMAACALFLTALPALGQTGAFTLYGVVRDFPRTHVDFGLPRNVGRLHVAGNVDPVSARDGDPVFGGGGFVVDGEWHEYEGNEIAPHMFNVITGSSVVLVSPAVTTNYSTLDTYDPALGPYGDTNIGPEPNVIAGSVMPEFPRPPTLGSSMGNQTYKQNGTTLINTSFRCNNFTLLSRHRITINGDVTIVVDGRFTAGHNTAIEINPGSSLTLFLMSDFSMGQNSSINTGDHTALKIFYAGISPVSLPLNATVYATLYAPNAVLDIQNNANFYGGVTARGLSMTNHSGLHIAGAGEASACVEVADVAGVQGAASDGSVNSAASFDQWFNTLPGMNANASVPLAFTKDDKGVFEFSTPDYTPIDNRLYGNEGEAHNRNFTLEVAAKFKNASCKGHFFEFTGDGDVWLFIDGKLVIDLAGPQIGGHQYIDIDRLGLVDGKTYRLRFYYAQRANRTHAFSIRTNLNLLNDLNAQAPAMAMFD